MNSLDERLLQCFAAVFPALAPGDLASASIENVEQWDSIAHVTLATVIEETFAITIDDDKAEDLTSFAAWRTYLQR